MIRRSGAKLRGASSHDIRRGGLKDLHNLPKDTFPFINSAITTVLGNPKSPTSIIENILNDIELDT